MEKIVSLSIMTVTARLSTLVLTCLLTLTPSSLALAADPVFESALACKECHTDIYDSWKKSMHAISYTNQVFMTSYRKVYLETRGKAKTLCLRCHAPTVRVTGDFDVELPVTSEGITCDFCHTISKINLEDLQNPFVLKPGKIKYSVLEKPKKSTHHGAAVIKDLALSKLCGGCHDVKNPHGLKLGMTHEEWLQSSFAEEGKQCQDCHMPMIPGKTANVDGRKMIHDHSMPHSFTTLNRAVKLRIKQTVRGDNLLKVMIEINNKDVGHYIPTGMLDQLVLKAFTISKSGLIIETKKVVYQIGVLNAKGEDVTDVGEAILNGVDIYADNRIRSVERRIETLFFTKKLNRLIELKRKFSSSTGQRLKRRWKYSYHLTKPVPFYTDL